MPIEQERTKSDELDKNGALTLPPFATLLNDRILIISDKSRHLAVDQHFFRLCLRPAIERIRFDQDWYLKCYPDVGEAIQKKIVPDAREHYVTYGYFENRLPYEILVNESWYLSQYPDVMDVVRQKHLPSGQVHYVTRGFAEGRIPYPKFSL
jgi:hypothetical protein